jgi:hypothetical protein
MLAGKLQNPPDKLCGAWKTISFLFIFTLWVDFNSRLTLLVGASPLHSHCFDLLEALQPYQFIAFSGGRIDRETGGHFYSIMGHSSNIHTSVTIKDICEGVFNYASNDMCSLVGGAIFYDILNR